MPAGNDVASGTPSASRQIVPWIIYLMFFAVLNETVFSVATPAVALRYGLTPSGVSWMMTVFMVLFGVGSVIFGRLADLFTLRKLITAGVLIYAAGSVMGFVLQFSYPLILLGRAVQGMGASAIPALVFVVVVRTVPEAERGRIFGLITSVVSLGIGLGPVIGGIVTSSIGWPFLFLIPLFMIVALPAIKRNLADEERRRGGVDVWGAILTALSVGSLVVFLDQTRWYYLVAGVVLMGALVARIRTAREPFIRASLFGNIGFRSAVLSAVCLFSVVIGTFFLVPLMLNDVYQLDSSRIGLILFPGAMSSVVVGPFGGRLADRRGNGFVAAVGIVLLVSGTVLMALLVSFSSLFVALAMLCIYVGFSLLQTAMINGVSQSLAPEDAGIGMGSFNLVGVISGAVGAAVAGRLLGANWLDFSILPLPMEANPTAGANVLLLFAVVAAVGGVSYLRSHRLQSRGTTLQTASGTIQPSQER